MSIPIVILIKNVIVSVDLRIFEKRRTFEALPVKQLILIMFLEGVVFSLQENHIDRRGGVKK